MELEPLPALATATVIDIQLELIRRRRFNRFHGPRVAASLQRHRALWTGIDFRRDGLPPDEGRSLGAMSLIVLRDVWNADTLYVLCDEPEQVDKMVEVSRRDRWNADIVESYTDSKELQSALGTSRPGAVVGFWWD